MPRIMDSNSTILEIGHVAGREGCLVHPCNGGNLGIRMMDRSSHCAASRRYLRIYTRCGAVEGQNAFGKVFGKNSLGRQQQRIAPLTRSV